MFVWKESWMRALILSSQVSLYPFSRANVPFVSSSLVSFLSVAARSINESKHKLPLLDTPPASSKVLKIEYERKFPGPAGLIPKTVTTSL